MTTRLPWLSPTRLRFPPISQLDINETELAELLRGPSGPVYRTTKGFADAIVASVRTVGPLGYDQGIGRRTGQLREGMAAIPQDNPADVSFLVGTDPINRTPNGKNYHYAERVHRGHGPVITDGTMVFRTRDGKWHRRHSIRGAAPVPFLYDAVRRVNATLPPDVQFNLIET